MNFFLTNLFPYILVVWIQIEQHLKVSQGLLPVLEVYVAVPPSIPGLPGQYVPRNNLKSGVYKVPYSPYPALVVWGINPNFSGCWEGNQVEFNTGKKQETGNQKIFILTDRKEKQILLEI